jgi:PAS domain S-box-containing protein
MPTRRHASCSARTREELLDLTFRMLSADKTSAIEELWSAFLASGTASGEWQLQRPDGETRILQYTAIARIAPGRHLSIIRDVTDVRRAQDEMRRTGEMFAKAFHTTPIVLAMVAEERVVDMNAAGLALLGRTRDEVIGKTGAELGLWGGDAAERARAVAEFRATGRLRGFPARLRHKSGALLDVLISVDVIEVRGQRVALNHIVDLTAQRTAERMLDESQERYRRIVEASPLGVVGPARRLPRDVRARARRRRRHRRDAAPAPRWHADRRVGDTLAGDGRGGARGRRVFGRPRHHDAEAAAGVAARGRAAPQPHPEDGGDRRARRRYRARLQQSAVGDPDLLDDGRGVAAAGAPGTGEGLGTIVNEARAIREAAERAASLTRQLLAFSRRENVAPRVVNLGGLIAGIETMLKRLLGERITLIVTPPDPGNAIIDPGQFEQIILNLSVNARDAMPDGGRLTIDCENVVIDEAGCAGTAAQPGPFVRVTVTDTGVGMDESTASRMFEPGFTTKGRTGTGLGLATVHAVVHQSGGFVRVDTRRGRGISVEVYLPRTDRAPESESVEVLLPAARRGGERILLVEDDELVRGRVEQVLRRDGYHVLVAANAGEAILLAEQEPKIDLMVTDVIMPIMDGRRLAERLRVHLSGLPVVYMSGYQNDEALRGMLASPNVSYLQKPVRPDVLLSRVREALDRR